jgi:Tol biopolymer transport system component/tRNA A-37 threonylcarbamoyl transferase component Bud32
VNLQRDVIFLVAMDNHPHDRRTLSDAPEGLRTALSDKYRIERELGVGGMATVYLAEDLKHQRRVAIKVLRPDLAATLGHARFLREVAIAANLQHPHILPVFDSGEASGFLFYVMPYVDGPSLRQKLIREVELPIADAVRVLRDVADAMAYAHERGVVHRDIKPENVMLSGRHALVTDFGVAKAVGEAADRHTLTTGGVALGTPTYMSPEQAAADPHTDHRADIYAFGAVAYELLTGQPPFTASTPQALLAKQIADLPEPITKHRDSVPPALAALTMHCLAKKPADRVQSAQELVVQLEALLTPSGGITPAGTPPLGLAVPLSSKRSRRYALMGGGVLLLVAAAALLVPRGAETGPALARARASQITFDGKVEAADLSPDGQLLAYISSQGPKWAIWVQDLGGGPPLRIAAVGSGELRWSPDGASLLHSGYDSVGKFRIVVYPRMGGAPRWTSEGPAAAGYAAWSRDANRIASWRQPGDWAISIFDLKSGRLDTIAAPDSLGFRYEGDWSPSGDHLVFSAFYFGPPQRWAIWTLSLRDSTLRRILEDSVRLVRPRWAASAGAQLFYLRGGDLWTVRLKANGSAGGEPTLVRAGLNAASLSLSGDAKKFVYVVRTGYRNLWIVPTINGVPRDDQAVPLTRGTARTIGSPSPDGGRVAYTSWAGESGGDVFTISVAGGQPEQLTSGRDVQSSPAWSPRSDALAFVGSVQGANKLRVVQMDTRNFRTFEKTELGSLSPVWAPGERILYHRAGNRNWHFLDAQTGAETPLVRNDSVGWMFSPQYSPDGQSVAVEWNRRQPGTWLVSLRDATQKLLMPDPFVPFAWSSDGAFVFTRSYKTGEALMVPVDGSQRTRSLGMPKDKRYDGCLPFKTPSGPAFLCGVSERSADAWLLTDLRGGTR